MNTVLSKFKLAAPTLLLMVVLAGFSRCKKDNDNKENQSHFGEAVAGKWEISSFTIDGVETMGAVIRASKMEFEAGISSKGNFEWSLIYSDGSGETQTGDYQEDFENKEVKLKSRDGDLLKLDVAIDGDDLELSGMLDGEHIVVKADRDWDQPQSTTLFIHNQL